MKITLELYKTRYTVESDQDDFTADELKGLFSRIMVVAGFPPGVIQLEEEEGGKYMYVGDKEVIISQEELEGLKGDPGLMPDKGGQ